MNTYKKNSGFSLLELMLSLLIMSVLMIGVVGYAASQAKDAKITKAADEITLLLQAGQAYFTANPNAKDISIQKLVQNNYLVSDRVMLNPWNENYKFEELTNYYFGVVTSVPKAVFDLVVAKLPATGTISEQDGKVRFITYMNKMPANKQAQSLASGSGYGAIRNATIVDGRAQLAVVIKKLQCAPHEIPQIFVAPAVITNDEATPIAQVAAYVTDPIKELWYVYQKSYENIFKQGNNSKTLVLAKCDAKQTMLANSVNPLAVF